MNYIEIRATGQGDMVIWLKWVGWMGAKSNRYLPIVADRL